MLLPALFGNAGTSSNLAVALGHHRAQGRRARRVHGRRRQPGRSRALLDHVAATGSRELFTLTVLVLALGIAVGSSLVFGVSMALGAFLAGLVVGRSEYSLRAASEALPMRDAFAVLFFVSVGMLLDPRLPDRSAWPDRGDARGGARRQAARRARARAAAASIRSASRSPSSIALAQIGEFSFILSSIGRDLGILTAEATNTLVAVSIISIVINPLLVPRGRARSSDGRRRGPGCGRLLNPPLVDEGADARRRRNREPILAAARSSSATVRPGAP